MTDAALTFDHPSRFWVVHTDTRAPYPLTTWDDKQAIDSGFLYVRSPSAYSPHRFQTQWRDGNHYRLVKRDDGFVTVVVVTGPFA